MSRGSDNGVEYNGNFSPINNGNWCSRCDQIYGVLKPDLEEYVQNLATDPDLLIFQPYLVEFA